MSEGISNITWNLDGKIRGVQRTHASARPDLAFWYDASGNRAVKLVQPTATEESWRYTYYLRDPQGPSTRLRTSTLATLTRGYTPAQACTGSTLPANATHVETLEVESYELYGASRLGTQQDTTRLRTFAFAGAGFTGLGYFQKSDTATQAFAAPDAGLAAPYWRGWKSYELANHLGNVLVTVSDRRTRDQFPNLGQTISVAAPDVRMAMDYDPFGAVEQGRKLVLTGYRYGFQGQEGDDEMYGEENSLSFKYRVHDVRLGRFLSVDPLSPKYPWNSPYAFSENRVIDAVELEGLEAVIAVIDGLGRSHGGPLTKVTEWDEVIIADAPMSFMFNAAQGIDQKSFAKAAWYITESKQSYLFTKIYQRNAYYSWAHSVAKQKDVYWFAAARDVTSITMVGVTQNVAERKENVYWHTNSKP